jgi:AcrR family transcriptional regulator
VSRPRPPDGRISRDKIVAVAVESMAAKGYRGTSLADVGATLGVSRQAIYHHFPDKSAILTAIFHALFDRLLEESEHICRAHPDPDRFLRLLASHLEIVLHDRALALVAIEAHRELPRSERPAVYDVRSRYLANLTDAYAAGVTAGVLRDVPPAFAVRLAIGTINWATRWYRHDGATSGEETRKHIHTLLLRGADTRAAHEAGIEPAPGRAPAR